MSTFYSMHFGCRANQADASSIERELSQKGFSRAGGSAEADVVILNSCTVTAAADAELRQVVRRIHRQNPQARVLVTGCYAQRRPEEVAALPGVEWVVGNSHKSEIAELLANRGAPAASNDFVPLAALDGTSETFAAESAIDSDLRPLGLARRPRILAGDIAAQRRFEAAPFFGGSFFHGPEEDHTRPNLKIQDGCNNRCSFCVIPSVRGLSRSLPAADVLAQIRSLCAQGYREVVLTGVNLGQYGGDLAPRFRFVDLIRAILNDTPLERLRLSSVEPMDFTDRLLDLMASTARLAKHVHAPLQSGSDRILRCMHRKYRAAQYRERILAARERMPEAAFGADVIVGFPGESGADFEATRRLIEELPFTYLHVFPFSRRPGTPADQMQAQVSGGVVRDRGRVLRELAAEKNRRFREQHLGHALRLLTLGKSGAPGTLALSDNYVKVIIEGLALPANQWIDSKITALGDGLLIGELLGGPQSCLPSELFAASPSGPSASPSMRTCASA